MEHFVISDSAKVAIKLQTTKLFCNISGGKSHIFVAGIGKHLHVFIRAYSVARCHPKLQSELVEHSGASAEECAWLIRGGGARGTSSMCV